MLYTKFIIILIFITGISSGKTLAQRQYQHWYFGEGAALDFRNGNPVPVINSAMTSSAASVSISDPNTEICYFILMPSRFGTKTIL